MSWELTKSENHPFSPIKALLTFQATPEVMATPSRAEPRPGILLVTLYEGRDFSLLGLEQASRSHQQNPLSTGEGSGEAGRLGSSEHSDIPAPYAATPGRISAKDLPYVLLDFDQVQVVVNAVSGTVKGQF